MARKERNFGTALGAPADPGNDIDWRAWVDDDTIAPNVGTGFHVQLTRGPAVPTVPAPGCQVFVICFGPAKVSGNTDGGIPFVFTFAFETIHPLQQGESQTADFHIDMGPAGGPYFLACFLSWSNGGAFALGPLAAPFLFTVP